MVRFHPTTFTAARRVLRSYLACWLILQFALVSAPLAYAAGPAGLGARISILAGDDTSIDLRITTGHPAAPEGWLLAAPPTGDVLLEVLSPEVAQAPVTITGEGWLRDQRVVRLTLAPGVAVQPEASATVRVHFMGAADAGSAEASPAEDPWFEGILRNALLNYEQGLRWRQRPTAAPSAPAALPFYPPQARLRLAAPVAGVYRLAGADLLAAGWPADWLATAGLQLSQNDRAYPLHVADGGDGNLDPEDYLEFYVSPGASRYAPGRVLWLDWVDPAPAERHLSASQPAAVAATTPVAFPSTLRLEEARVYRSDLALRGDPWFWQRLTVRRDTVVTYRFPFPLNAPYPSDTPAVLSMRLQPLESPPYQLSVSLNGQLLLDYLWEPTQNTLVTASFSDAILRDGTNELVLTLTHSGPNSAQSLLLDWFELSYQQSYASSGDQAAFAAPKPGTWQFRIPGFSAADVSVYDVTTADFPRRITDAEVIAEGESYSLRFAAQGDTRTRFVAAAGPATLTPQVQLVEPSDTLAPQDGADWIALAPAELAAALEPLAERRAAQGLRARVVDLAEVYNAYGGGQPEPRAIQRFLADAYASWPGPPPTFVLLAGDGSYDPRNYLGVNRPIGIPPFLATVDPIIGETAAENSFAAVRGVDPLPDVIVGRIPADTIDELGAVVTKILAYEDQEPWTAGNWPLRHFFLADNPDGAGDFHLFADAAAAAIPRHHRVDEFYFSLPGYESAADARAAVVKALNEGLLTLNYVGHGTPDAWGGERLFAPELIPQLTNADHAPPAWSMSSLNGYFIEPATRSFLEHMLLAPNGGVSAYIASTGVGLVLGNYLMHYGGLWQTMRRSPPLVGFGFVGGKITLYTQGAAYTQWLVQTYALFGDPAQRLYLPQGGIYMPLLLSGRPAPQRLPIITAGLQPE